MKVYEKISEIFDLLVQYLILLVELVGIIILIYAIVMAVIGLIRRQSHVRLKLAEGIALALEFKMGGELLRTVIVREWNELLILGAIILLRAALTFLIQWEIKIERKNGKMSDRELFDVKIRSPYAEADNKNIQKRGYVRARSRLRAFESLRRQGDKSGRKDGRGLAYSRGNGGACRNGRKKRCVRSAVRMPSESHSRQRRNKNAEKSLCGREYRRCRLRPFGNAGQSGKQN